jgi:outer membrane protein OmpA-like peptidoglycan-associated protein
MHTLDRGTISEIAGALGTSEQAVSRGTEASMAGTLAGLTSQSRDPSMLRKILDLAPSGSGETSWSNIISSLGSSNSPLIVGGKKILSALFGTSENTVVNAISSESGLGTGSTSTLLAMAAPMVIGFLNKRVRDEGMTMSGLASLLQRESATIRNALPAGLADLFWPRAAAAGTTTGSPVIAQSVKADTRSSNWLPALALALLALGVFWLFNHRRPISQMPTGTASRMATEGTRLGTFVTRPLPNHVILNIPQQGVEWRLLGFIQDPNRRVDSTTWFDFDRLVFNTGSATVRPESEEQLNNIAAIMNAYPKTRIKVGGYTDNVGDPAANQKLSQDRADTVKAELVKRGIAPDRLTTEGYGEQHPVADNGTEAGKASNRRVSMRVTDKG